MTKKIVTTLLFIQLGVLLFSQNVIKGIVTDTDNGESLVGCNIILQGTNIGTVTNLDGNYELKNVSPGTYNIVFSYISYEKYIQKIVVEKNSTLTINAKLQPQTQLIKDIVVIANKRTDTELSLLMNAKTNTLTVNGISSQQIAKSLDKDASEVIRRVPGVSIRDGKFIIVRGLTERYNSVWLNGSSTPSSESDVRAFSFDIIPSGQIDNILIYKTAAPELPADFAGAMINIKTKSLIDKNSISFSYSYGYLQGTTGNVFYSYQGGKTDWLGYDDGTRGIPSEVPTTEECKLLFNQTTPAKIEQINAISKSFNTIMAPYQTIAKPDADFQMAINKRFTLGTISIGTITALGYNSTNSTENKFRAAYWAYPDTSFRYLQQSFASKVRLSALSNWTFTFGNNQKIEFRNLLNNYGMSKTVLREGFDFYRQNNERSYELGYESRLTYSGQLAGNHIFNNEKIKFDWVLGYSYANKQQPDIRRVEFNPADVEQGSQYYATLSTQVVSDALGRLTLTNEEDILNGGLNYAHKFSFGSFKPELKAGAYYEKKQRDFNSRQFGYVLSSKSRMYFYPIQSFNGKDGFDQEMFNSITDFFKSKIDFNTGMVVSESTQKADSYNAENDMKAGYLALNIPIKKWLNAYFGVRVESNKLALNGFKRDGTDNNPINVTIDSINVFPSLNLSINLTDKLVLRLAGAKTINRPEFREVSPFVFYSFEDNAISYGNPEIVNCYIQNSDIRFEWYPTNEEIVSIGGFYKDFMNPIESKILITGSGWNYTFENADKAKSYGVELDVRKRLHELENAGAFKFLSNLTFVLNASLIKSIIKTDSILEGASERELQGQSPYIMNLGVYYNDVKSNFMASVMYNKVGKRIAVVGDINTPHIYEMPFNSLDFTLEKGINKWLSVKFGIKNILDDEIVFQQFQKYTDNAESKIREQVTTKYKPGRQFKLSVSIKL